MKLQKNHHNKKCALNLLFFNEKNSEIWTIFDLKNSLRKSNFRTLRQAGKARQSIPVRLLSGKMANFVSSFEKWGRRRRRFLPTFMTLIKDMYGKTIKKIDLSCVRV